MLHQQNIKTQVGPNHEVIWIDKPGYYVIPKQQTSKVTRKRSTTTKKKANKPTQNYFKVEIQAWHVIAIIMSAGFIAAAIVLG